MAQVDMFAARKLLSQDARPSSRQLRRQAAGAALILMLGGSYALWHANAKPEAPMAPPAIPVTVQTVKPRSISPFSEFSGRITAVDYAEIRPQVTGRITAIRFQDGQMVKAGDVLFVIDPRPYEAAAAKAAADLASARTTAALAQVNLARAVKLKASGAIALQAYDQAVSTNDVAQAAIKSAAATLAQAQVDVDNAYIKAPISGRVSRAEITLGNLVGSPTAPPPLLASVMSNDGVYADFEVDEQTYLNSVRANVAHHPVPVELTVQGDTHVYRGVIESFDNHIATGSGTIRARARFANDDGALVPGMFVSVRMGGRAMPNALLVPESAIGNDQSKRFVYIATPANTVAYREVALGTALDGQRVVTSGLKAGDRVILDGLQKLAPGAPISPQPLRTAAN